MVLPNRDVVTGRRPQDVRGKIVPTHTSCCPAERHKESNGRRTRYTSHAEKHIIFYDNWVITDYWPVFDFIVVSAG